MASDDIDIISNKMVIRHKNYLQDNWLKNYEEPTHRNWHDRDLF